MSQLSREAMLADVGIWKAWALICLAEASRMGFAPLASTQIHVLLYLANTLAPLFEVAPVRGRILKRGAYPFYPDVQRELDRLAFSGIFFIERVDFGPHRHLTAHYGLGPRGSSVCTALVAHSKEAERTARLFRELVSACFGKFIGTQTAIGSIDANYGNDDVLEGEVVDFSEWQDENKNMEVARYLVDKMRALRPHADRDGMRLYCDYLDQALAIS
ncbi:hypothetical protein [Nitrosospira briensis]|uniref:hypothetical protein n=1 Tax=Nitrosospira briensis TaxID=35799 RepID=UPI000469FD2D|nr:hypothetical protein [Nitrosospira briensis]